jgi:glutamyl-tRNA reductase
MQNNTSFEHWVEKSVEGEISRALAEVRSGVNHEQILQQFAYRLNRKLLHWIIEDIKKSYTTPYDNQLEKQKYQEKYLSKRILIADHVLDDENS